jgi:hypothetical protein
MIQPHTHYVPVLTAAHPEHCLDCFRLIHPGETYYLGKDGTVLCPNCVSDLLIGEDFDTIQATEQVAVDYGGVLIRVGREGAAIIVAPGEVRHLVDALVEAATRVVDEQAERM